jgi:hypothetical protein
MKVQFVVLLISAFFLSDLYGSPPKGEDPATAFYEGFLILKTSTDTLRGLIQMGSPKYGKKFVVLKQQDKSSPIEKTSVSLIRLYYSDKSDNSQKFTDFKPIDFDKNVLWRSLGAGKAEVYDDELFPDTKRYYLGSSLGDLSGANIFNLIVVNKEGIVRVPSSVVNWGVPKKRNHFLLEFINNRYKKNFGKNDFASNGDMIRYIIANG